MNLIDKSLLVGLQVIAVLSLTCAPVIAAEHGHDHDPGRQQDIDLYDRNRLQLDFNPYYDPNGQRGYDNQGGYYYNQGNYNSPQQQNANNDSYYYYPNN